MRQIKPGRGSTACNLQISRQKLISLGEDILPEILSAVQEPPKYLLQFAKRPAIFFRLKAQQEVLYMTSDSPIESNPTMQNDVAPPSNIFRILALRYVCMICRLSLRRILKANLLITC